MRESCFGALDLAAENRNDAADKLDARLQCRAHSLRPSTSAAFVGVEHLLFVAGIGQEPLGEVLLEEKGLGLPCTPHQTPVSV